MRVLLIKTTRLFALSALLSITALCGLSARAQDVEFTSYYPTPRGEFSELHLSPRDLGSTGESCFLGSIYMNNAEHQPYLCADDGAGNGIWGPLSNSIWNVRSISPSAELSYSALELQSVSTEEPQEPPLANTIISLGNLDPEQNPPELGLHLYENAGFVFTGYIDDTSTTADDIDFTLPPPGLGSHFIWHPKKGALRIGVLSNYPDSIEGSIIADCESACETERTVCESGCSGDPVCIDTCDVEEQTCKEACQNTNTGVDDSNNYVDFSDGTGLWDENNIGKYSVVIGHNQLARGDFSSSLGRSSAQAYGPFSTVIGSGSTGQEDGSATCTTDPDASAPGCYSTAFFSDIEGYASAGKGEIAGNYSFFGASSSGGKVLSDYSASLSGYFPKVCWNADYSALFSGSHNAIGTLNYAYCPTTPVASTQFDYSILVSGTHNIIYSAYNTIFSGLTNTIKEKTHSTIVAGNSNTIQGDGQGSVILSGKNNTVSGNYSTITNGYNNTIETDYSTILAGHDNTIRQASTATTGGEYSTIINGHNNFVESNHSLLFGRNVHLTENADRTFAFAFNDGTCTYSAGTYSSDCLNIDTNDAFILYTEDGNSDNVGDMKLAINNTSPSHPLHVNSSGNATYIEADGDLYVQNAGPVGISDRRMKKNITAIQNPLDRLMSLSPKSFLWKEKTRNNPGGPSLGFIAQEVQPLFPQWVGTGSDNFLTFNPNGIEGLITEAIRELHVNTYTYHKNIEHELKTVASLLAEAQNNKRIIQEKQALIKKQRDRISALKKD